MNKKSKGSLKKKFGENWTPIPKGGFFRNKDPYDPLVTKYRDTYRYTEKWKKIRQKRLEHDGHRCVRCGSTEQLQVHHCYYRNYTNEKLEDLQTLCKHCHYMRHFNRYGKRRSERAFIFPGTKKEMKPLRSIHKYLAYHGMVGDLPWAEAAKTLNWRAILKKPANRPLKNLAQCA